MISPILPRFRAPAAVCRFLLLCGAFSVAHAAEPQTFPDFRVAIRSPGDEPINLPAAAENSGLPLTWTVAAGPVTVAGNVATLTGALGGVTLRATQAGNSEWEPLERFVTFPVTEEGAYQEVSGLSGLSTTSQMLAINQAGRMIKISRQARPVAVWTDVLWKTVSSGRYQLAVSRDGRLFSWGRASSGELGHGLIREELVAPLQVGTDTDWSLACAGPAISAAIKKNGTLWAWGAAFRPDMGVPRQIGAFTDWNGLSSDGAETLVMARSNGLIYGPNFTSFPSITPITNWETASTSAGGLLGIRKDGTLWIGGYSGYLQVSPKTDWLEVSVGRTHYLARRAEGGLWVGGVQSYGYPNGPIELTAGALRWKFLHAGFFQSAMISDDGGIWMLSPNGFFPAVGTPKFELSLGNHGSLGTSSLYRLAPDYFPQTLSFLENRERPMPVLTGSTIRAGAAECASGMPPAVTVLSGPATLVGDVITFTGEGPVEIAFSRPGDNTWSALDERVTFLAGPPGPEIAVHDGPLAAAPTRAADGPVAALGACTRAVSAAGILRSFTIENTGQQPLLLTEITAEAASALTFSAEPASTVTIPPGGSFRLDLTLRTAEYGSHALTILLHTNDADEPVFRLPFTITVANTAPVASAGPDRAIPEGRAVRLDAAIFTTDSETPAADLDYAWDLEGGGGGYVRTGAAQTITLAAPGQSLTAKLRVRDADGAESFSQCVLTATPPDAPPATAIRVLAGQETQLVFPGEPGAKYEVQQSTSLQFWTRAAIANHPPDEPNVCGPDGFFAVRLRLPLFNTEGFYRAIRRE